MKDQKIIAVGGSAGALEPLKAFFRLVESSTQASFIVSIHRPYGLKSNLPEILKRCSNLAVETIDAGDQLECATIHVERPGQVVGVNSDGLIDTWKDVLKNMRCRSIDELFFSVAKSFKENSIGVILSGSNDDGAKGIREINRVGGFTMAQSPDDAEFTKMPTQAVELSNIDHVGTIPELVDRLTILLAKENYAS